MGIQISHGYALRPVARDSSCSIRQSARDARATLKDDAFRSD
jgi:hypothetical protein